MKNDIKFDDLLEICARNFKNNNSLNEIRKAYEYALKNHEGRKRLTGDDYISHPLNVAETTIVAALVHETINNGNATEEELEKLFGKDVRLIVTAISKINKLELADNSDSSAIYLRKVLVGMSEDVRVLYVKLADRLHNMRTIWAVREEKQKRKANETMTVLVPIAHRLGINSIKSELENICLKYLKPDVYEDIYNKLDADKKHLNEVLEDMKDAISDILIDNFSDGASYTVSYYLVNDYGGEYLERTLITTLNVEGKGQLNLGKIRVLSYEGSLNRFVIEFDDDFSSNELKEVLVNNQVIFKNERDSLLKYIFFIIIAFVFGLVVPVSIKMIIKKK